MKRFDVAVIGNLFLDRVYRRADWPRRDRANFADAAWDNVGGIANVARQLRVVDPDLDVQMLSAIGDDSAGDILLRLLRKEGWDASGVTVVPGDVTTSATILVDSSRSERTSVVAWGVCSEAPLRQQFEADWCHFAYLDTMRGVSQIDLSRLRDAGSIVSVDLSRSEHSDTARTRLFDTFGSVDYLIVSDVECEGLLGRVDSEAVRQLGYAVEGWAFVHDPKGSYFSNGKSISRVDTALDPEIKDVLGAGDAFAGSLIARLKRGDDVEAAVRRAHELATESLKQRV